MKYFKIIHIWLRPYYHQKFAHVIRDSVQRSTGPPKQLELFLILMKIGCLVIIFYEFISGCWFPLKIIFILSHAVLVKNFFKLSYLRYCCDAPQVKVFIQLIITYVLYFNSEKKNLLSFMYVQFTKKFFCQIRKQNVEYLDPQQRSAIYYFTEKMTIMRLSLV